MPAIILYSDPNCPFCYALGERLDVLGLDGLVEWRGVQHAPMLAVPRAVHAPRMNVMIQQEVRAVQHLASEVPIQVVTGKPNTGPAIRLVAAAEQINARRARQLRLDLYRALWQCNEDISDPKVLTLAARALGFSELAAECAGESAGAARARAWQQAWEDTGVGSVPLLVRPDGESLSGLVGAEVLKSFVVGSGAASEGRP